MTYQGMLFRIQLDTVLDIRLGEAQFEGMEQLCFIMAYLPDPVF